MPDPGDPQALNRYSYVLNNPLRFSDPTGMFGEDEIMKYLGVGTWDDVLAMFGEGGEMAGRWGWLDILRETQLGDTVQMWRDTSSGWNVRQPDIVGSFYEENGKLKISGAIMLWSNIETESPAAVLFSLPGEMGGGMISNSGLYRLKSEDRYRQANYNPTGLHIYPGNLPTDPIPLWHYSEAASMGAGLDALGVGMIGTGVGLCTTVLGCVACGELVITGGTSIASGIMIH